MLDRLVAGVRDPVDSTGGAYRVDLVERRIQMIVITLDDILNMIAIIVGVILVLAWWLSGEFGSEKRGGKK